MGNFDHNHISKMCESIKAIDEREHMQYKMPVFRGIIMSAILFCIDMQESVKKRIDNAGSLFSCLRHIPKIIRTFGDAGIPTWYLALAEMETTITDFRTALPLLREYDAFSLRVAEAATVVIRGSHSACDDKIRSCLKSVGADHLFFVGVWECGRDKRAFEKSCVSVSARDFREAGYKTTIISEGTNRYSELTLDQRRVIHEAHGVRVEPLQTIIDELRPNFEPATAAIGIGVGGSK